MKHYRIEASIGFWTFLCVLYYFNPANSFFPFLMSAGLHECGHIVALRFSKLKIHSLRFTAGGVILETSPLSYRHELVVSLAGPTVNVLLLFLTARSYPLFALVNLCLLLYNMLPLYPLDGGRALRATLHLLLEERAAHAMETLLGVLCFLSILITCIYLTCVWHAGLWPILLSGMLLFRILETIPRRCRNTS